MIDHATAHPGQRLTYTLTVTDDGLDDDPDVIVTDTWRLPLKILAIRPAQGTCHLAPTLTCELGTIKRYAGTTIVIVATTNHAGQERNTARATGANRDPNLHNNQSTAETDVTPIPRTPNKAPTFTG